METQFDIDQFEIDNQCTFICKNSNVFVRIKNGYLCVQNTHMKISFKLDELRMSLIMPERSLILIDNHNRIEIAFCDTDVVSHFIDYIKLRKTY